MEGLLSPRSTSTRRPCRACRPRASGSAERSHRMAGSQASREDWQRHLSKSTRCCELETTSSSWRPTRLNMVRFRGPTAGSSSSGRSIPYAPGGRTRTCERNTAISHELARDSVCSLRYFCRSGEAPGRRTIDPFRPWAWRSHRNAALLRTCL
jgi:hypothetical protein